MKKIYSAEEIQTIEKKEFKKLRNSYVLMKRFKKPKTLAGLII